MGRPKLKRRAPLNTGAPVSVARLAEAEMGPGVHLGDVRLTPYSLSAAMPAGALYPLATWLALRGR